MVGNRATAIIRSQLTTGLTPDVIAQLVAKIGPLWHERHKESLTSRPRRRTVGAKHKLAFVERLLATLVHPCHGATHDVLACWFGVDRSTITHAIGEVRPLLAARAAPSRPTSGCGRSPMSSSISERAGRPESSTAPRSGCVGRQLGVGTGRSSSAGRTSRTP
ncbi:MULTISPECIES: transposase family protein [unclassified Streptomyces]|uniref:helix-turn-helix domain-containing protein n=1 Tax=unclassified Streptomyces TaxID=2593676 RepID=UPI00340F103A